MNTKPLALILFVAVVVAGDARAALLQTLGSDWPYGIDGHNVVGVKGTGLGFLYNDLTQTSMTLPRLNNRSTPAFGISGNNIVGGYRDLLGTDFGSLYSISTGTHTTFGHPLAGQGVGKGTTPTDIDGDNVVGNYVDAAGKQHGFLYNLATQTWTTLDYPGAKYSSLTGVSGSYIVGLGGNIAGFLDTGLLYDLAASTWTTIPFYPLGIEGDNVVGRGVLYNMYNLRTGTFSNPLIGVHFPAGQIVQSVTLNDISGNTVVGTYHYYDGRFFHDSGFVYIGVPELGTFALTAIVAALGVSSLRRVRRRAAP